MGFRKYFVPLPCMKIKIISILLLLSFFSPIANACEKNDSTYIQQRYNFKAKQLIVPGTVFAVGATSLFLPPMKKLDHYIQKEMVNLRGSHNRVSVDEYLRFVPTATNFVLHFAGAKCNYNIKESLLAEATSFVAMYALTQGLKYTIRKTRPDGSDTHSFPSGHVATVFMGAESLRINCGNWWGLAGYTVATGVAFCRMYNNRHWLGDVIGAAGIGILSARIGYWLVPWESKILGLDKKKQKNNTSFMAVPSYDAMNNSFGMTMAMQF